MKIPKSITPTLFLACVVAGAIAYAALKFGEMWERVG